MRVFTILIMITFALALVCQSEEPVKISRNTGMSVLDDLTANSTNGTLNATMDNSSSNASSENQSAAVQSESASGLWSWGSIPEGYVLDENGTLTETKSEVWKPSI